MTDGPAAAQGGHWPDNTRGECDVRA